MTKKGKSKKFEKEDKTKKLEEQLVRALADYDNLRKRVERGKEEFEQLAKLKFVIRMLPIADMLNEAQVHSGDSGIAIISEELRELFKQEGFEEIDVNVGDKFNEEIHEAVEVAEIPSKKKKDGKIAEIILTGWKMIDGLVIRPAKVKVYKK